MKRSEIKLSDFGLPSKKKYPMPDEKHVKSAIRFFNYVDPEDEKELADNIKKKMKKYGISPQSVGDTNRLKKYISESFQEPSGIDTIIFDFGAVLVHDLDSEKALEEAGIPKEYISEILSTMMSAYKKVDSEQFTIPETIEFFTRALRQELKTYAAAAWYAYQSANVKYPYTVDLLKILKSNGYKIYYLSNWDKAGHEQCVRNGLFDFIDIFDGGIFSYQVGSVKPDKRIYELLLKRYSIDPSKAIFFDDREENIASAKELGIHGIVFTPDIGYDLLESQKKKSNNTAVEEDSIVTEGYFKSSDDVYYNKGKFDSGEINLCFITGLSGSGKSTMGRKMQGGNVEHYELDDLMQNYDFSDSNLKEYGDLIYSFFTGPGKKYRMKEESDLDTICPGVKDLDKSIVRDFVKYAMSYSKSHKNTKFVLDGIWVFMFFEPSELKNYAVYIKGTSGIKSAWRASSRDAKTDNGSAVKNFMWRVKYDVVHSEEFGRKLDRFRSYFSKEQNKINEFVQSILEEPIIAEEAILQEGYLSQATMAYRIHPRKTLEQILKTHKYEGLLNMAVKCKKEEDVRYLLRDYRTGKAYFMKIMERIEKCNRLGDCKETHNYYKGVKKKFIDNGITVKDVQLTIKWYDDVYCPALKSRLKELKEKNAHVHEFVQSILEEPMVGSSKVFIVNNMMHNTFVGCGYGDDTSIQHFKPAKDIDLSTNDINELIKDGVAQVYEYVGPRSYMDMCISESASYTTVDRDYFKRVYIEVCSEADAIYEIEKHSMLGEINTQIKKDPVAVLAEATVYPTPRDTNLLVISEEFKNSPLLEIHRDTDGYYIKNAITNKRSKSREESSAVPYNVVKCLISNNW